MNLEELRSVRRTERQKDSLQHLRDSFYEDVAAYIEERKAERRRAADAAADPFGDPDVGRLTDEIETAEDVVESIYERRVGKLVKLASFAAADMGADTNGLTAEEQALFDDLVARIKRNRRTVLDVLAGEGGDGSEVGERDATEAGSGTETGLEPSPAGDAIDGPPEPDDVLAEAMGGSDGPGSSADGAESDSAPAAAPPEATPSDSPDGPPAESSPASPTDVPPDAPDGASVREAEVVDVDVDERAGGVDGTGRAADPGGSGQTDGGTRSSNRRAEANAESGAGGESEANGGPGAAGESEPTDRVTLRITEDVGQIFGIDEREYDLESEDVVTLPTTNAGPLLDRDAAERLD